VVDAAVAVDEPDDVDEFEAVEATRFPSPNRPKEEGRISSALVLLSRLPTRPRSFFLLRETESLSLPFA